MRKNRSLKKLCFCMMVPLVFSLASSAQDRATDSLKQLLQNEKTDTGRILLLSKLSFGLVDSNPDTAMTLALQTLELSTKIQYDRGKVFAYNDMGNAYAVIGNYPKAMEAFLKELKISEQIKGSPTIQASLANIAEVFREQGDYRQALAYNFRAKAIAGKWGKKRQLSGILGNIGDNYRQLKVYDSATLYALQSFNLGKQIDNARTCGGSLALLGDTYFEMGQYKLALDYCQAGFPYLERSQNYTALSQAYLTCANIFYRLSRKDSALFYGEAALKLAKESEFTRQVRDAALFLSRYFRTYNADSAFYYQDIFQAMNDSLFSQEKQHHLQSLQFGEKMRQQELEAQKMQEEEKRKQDMQYAAIAVALVTFVILFFLFSRSVSVNHKFIRFFGILGLLAVFEFINLFIHPYLAHLTHDSPVLMLLILMGIAALLIPLHHRVEHWVTHKLTEKNIRLRLAAARKTIEKLEGKAGITAPGKETTTTGLPDA